MRVLGVELEMIRQTKTEVQEVFRRRREEQFRAEMAQLSHDERAGVKRLNSEIDAGRITVREILVSAVPGAAKKKKKSSYYAAKKKYRKQ